MRNLPRQQRGMTGLGILIIVAMVGVFVLVGLRLMPSYLESMRVQGQLSSLSEDPAVDGKSPAEIRKLLQRRFSIDDVRSVKPEQVKIEKGNGMVVIDINYEVRTPVIGNIDAVTVFSMHEEFRAR